MTGAEIVLSVEDDGPTHDDAAVSRPGMGLLGMRERVAMLGGRLTIASNASGTMLRAVIPVAAEPVVECAA